MSELAELLGLGADDVIVVLAALTAASMIGVIGYLLSNEFVAVVGMRKQLVRVNARQTGASAAAKARAIRESDGPGLLGTLFKGFDSPLKSLREAIERTGKPIRLERYLLGCLVVGAALFGLVLVTPVGSTRLAAIAGVVGAFVLPRFYLSSLASRRTKRFLGEFPEAIDLIVRNVRAGLPIVEGIAAVAREVSGPVGEEFMRAEQGVRLGRTLEDALWECARRIAGPEFKFFVISLSVQKETGGNLAETLENLADILRRRRAMKLKIRALSSEARASAFIIGSLPFVMFSILMVVNPGYVGQLLTDPRGHVMLAMGLGSILTGVLTMAKMIRFEV
jgi:tight adherence protein B